jgi:arginase family enzyme
MRKGATSMAVTPTYAIPPSFLGVTRTDLDADYVVAGVPMDIGTTNRSGTRDGPAAIRQASRMLTDGDHPEHCVEPARMSIADIGDFQLALGDIQGSLAAIQSQAEAIGQSVRTAGPSPKQRRSRCSGQPATAPMSCAALSCCRLT